MTEQTNAPTRPTLDELKAMTRYGDRTGTEGGVCIVSGDGKPLRVLISYGKAHRVWLQERQNGAAIQIETGRSTEDRRSTETTDWSKAVAQADAIIKVAAMRDHVREQSLRAVQESRDGGVEFTVIGDYYEEQRVVKGAAEPVSKGQGGTVSRVLAILKLERGSTFRTSDITNPREFAMWYIDLRTKKRIVFPKAFNRRACGPVIKKSAVSELKDLSSAMSYAVKNGRCASNPLDRYDYDQHLDGDQHEAEHREEWTMERYGALMTRPKLYDENGARLQAPVHRTKAKDGGARLRGVTAFTFYTGRRISTAVGVERAGEILHPIVADLLRTEDEMKKALRETKNHRTSWAKHWPHGAIRIRVDKQDYCRVIPMSARFRREMDLWMQSHPCPNNKSAPLFPGLSRSDHTLNYGTVYKQLKQAERIARADCAKLGLDPDEVVPELKDSAFHGGRAAWETLMDTLGYGWAAAEGSAGAKLELHKHVAFMGGWDVGGAGGVQGAVYLRLNPAIMLAVAEFTKAADVIARFSEVAKDGLEDVLAAIDEDLEDAA